VKYFVAPNLFVGEQALLKVTLLRIGPSSRPEAAANYLLRSREINLGSAHINAESTPININPISECTSFTLYSMHFYYPRYHNGWLNLPKYLTSDSPSRQCEHQTSKWIYLSKVETRCREVCGCRYLEDRIRQ
jgi:hypothetical protein